MKEKEEDIKNFSYDLNIKHFIFIFDIYFYKKYETVENEFLYLIQFFKYFKYNFISWKYFILFILFT